MEGVTHVAGIEAVLNKPLSTGNVFMRSKDPRALPTVNPNYLADQIDVLAAREMVRAGFKLFVSPEMQAVLGPPLNMDQKTLGSDERLDAAIYKTSPPRIISSAPVRWHLLSGEVLLMRAGECGDLLVWSSVMRRLSLLCRRRTLCCRQR